MTILRSKLVVVGDPTVGKSALIQSFHSDGTHFPKNYNMTTGVELCVKMVNIPDSQDTVDLYIYDCAGDTIFSDFIEQHWDHPSCVAIVFDVTNTTSFSNVKKWADRIRAKRGGVYIPGVLIGNKTDLKQRRTITEEEARKTAADLDLEYFEVTTKEYANVEAPFYFLCNAFHKLFMEKVAYFNQEQ